MWNDAIRTYKTPDSLLRRHYSARSRRTPWMIVEMVVIRNSVTRTGSVCVLAMLLCPALSRASGEYGSILRQTLPSYIYLDLRAR